MGASASQNAESEYTKFISDYTHNGKELSPILGHQIDIYRPVNPFFPEEEIIIVEIPFDDPKGAKMTSMSFNDPIQKLKAQIAQRKKFICPTLSNMIWQNHRVDTMLCSERILCQLAFEYSDTTLARHIEDTRISIGPGQAAKIFLSSSRATNFIGQIAECLTILKAHGIIHGFVMPRTVLMLNVNAEKPKYKLLDVALIGFYPKFGNQRV